MSNRNHWERFIRPGIFMMNRLKYPGKFGLVGLVLIFPLLIVLNQFLTGINNDIEFSSKEQVGLEYNAGILRFLQLVQQHGTFSAAYLSGDDTLLDAIMATQGQIQAQIETQNKVDANIGDYLDVRADWRTLRDSWISLQNRTFGLSIAENFEAHNTLIDNILRVITVVGNNSNLILDPDIDTYYLMDVLINKQPLAAKYSHQIQMYSAAMMARGTINVEDRTRLTILAGILRNALTQLDASFGYTFGFTPAVQSRIQPAIEANRAATETLLRLVNDQLLRVRINTNGDGADVGMVEAKLADFLPATEPALQAIFDLYNTTSPVENDLIQVRVNGYVMVRNLTILVTLVALAVAVYLFTTFYLAVKRTIAKLEETSARMVAGQTEETLVLENHDELAQVALSFNNIATELIQTRDRALEGSRAKSTFLANMSHELRTPLNAIIGYSELIEEEAEDDGNAHYVPDLQKIQAAAKHLLSLINDILDFSKIEAGKMELYLETIDLAKMMEEIKATIQPMIDKNNNALVIHKPDQPGTMYADLTRIRQIMFNLLSNASKFTHDGTITLTLERRQTVHGERVRLIVQDTGIGMTNEQMNKLFQEFSQADASTTRKFGGTGLGLAISRRFCQMMGGDITVTSELNLGSIFTVDIPATVSTIQELETRPELPPIASGSGRYGTVMVIDDDATVREILQRYLEKASFRVVPVSSGKEALAKAKDLQPDVITLDVMMPGMDGWAVLTALKADAATAHIPVVMLTMHQDKDMGYALGATDYLTKPIEREKLVAVLKKFERPDGGKPGKILVVEDDEHTRTVICRMLLKEGWHVNYAENGKQGLESFIKYQQDIILLDLMMPVMDGFQFLAELRKLENGQQPAVLVVTAMDLSQREREQLNGQVWQILQKGAYSRDQLLGEVSQMLKNLIQRESI